MLAFGILLPLAATSCWTLMAFANRRWQKRHVVGLGPSFLFVVGVIVATAVLTNQQAEARRAAIEQKEHEDAARLAAEQERRDKANEMRAAGTGGTDEELEQTYNRVKAQSDSDAARRERLRNR